MSNPVRSSACGLCREEPVAFRYQTFAVEAPTLDGGAFRADEASWNVCAVCSELVEARRWPDLAERVYAARADDVPPELSARAREAATRAVDLFTSAALTPRRPLVDLGGGPAPLPTPQQVADLASISDDDGDDESREWTDWELVADAMMRAQAAGEIHAGWRVESDLSFTGEFWFAILRYRWNDGDEELLVQSFFENDGGWTIIADAPDVCEENSQTDPNDITPVLRRGEELLRAMGAVVLEPETERDGDDDTAG